MDNYRNTPEYREWQKMVKERDGFGCRSCQTKQYLDVHHIFRVESHPHLSDHIDNGITLCKNCHVKLKNKENDTNFLIEVVIQPLKEQMNRLNQTNRSIQRVLKSDESDIGTEENAQAIQQPYSISTGRSESDNLRTTTRRPNVKQKIADLIVIPAQFDDDEAGTYFSEGLVWFCIKIDFNRGCDKYGFINRNGEIIIPAQFDNVEDFSEGLARFCDRNGKHAFQVSEEKYGYIDQKGEIVISQKLVIPAHKGRSFDGEVRNFSRNFSEGLASFRDGNNKYGFINRNGEIVIPAQFDGVGDFSEGLVWFSSQSGKKGVIDPKGKLVIPAQFDDVGNFSEGLARFCIETDLRTKSYKYGFINRNGEVVIPQRLDEVEDFSEGLARFCGVNGNRGYIDQKGEFIIPARLGYNAEDSEGYFKDGLARFWDKDKMKWGFIKNPLNA